jgi:hypothetical protein
MKIALYQRTFPVNDAPVTFSLFPFAGHQRHTFTVGDRVYEATCTELQVIVPDDAKVDPLKHLLSWNGEKGSVKSTAREVFDLAQAGDSGFRMVK